MELVIDLAAGERTGSYLNTLFRIGLYHGPMTNREVRGEVEKQRGKIREAVGKATGDKGEEVHGKIEQAAGEAKKKIGKVGRSYLNELSLKMEQ